ncbi:hypothetical protein, partial [Pigmentiphaga soli]|uniref:hypothetical protein n=1 Tax=Pigmentiphaga soli TaxID=1007095 RepID=UPI0031E562CA
MQHPSRTVGADPGVQAPAGVSRRSFLAGMSAAGAYACASPLRGAQAAVPGGGGGPAAAPPAAA